MRNYLVSFLFLVSAISGLRGVSFSAGQGCLNGDCHREMIRARYLHGPVAAEMAGAKGCEICHRPIGDKCTPTKGGSFQTAVKNICTTCHGKGTGSQHTQAAVESRCIECHDPHGSETSPQLLRSRKK